MMNTVIKKFLIIVSVIMITQGSVVGMQPPASLSDDEVGEEFVSCFVRIVAVLCDAAYYVDQYPLHAAIKRNRRDLGQQFLSDSALAEIIRCEKKLLNTLDSDGQAPLHVACKCHSLYAVRKLVEAGAHLTVRNEEGKLPIEYADGQVLEFLRALSGS